MFTSLNMGNLGFSAPFEEALHLAKSNGFAALDLSLDELLIRVQQHSVSEVLERFQASGLQPGGWGLPVDFRSTEESYQADLARLPQYAALAQQLGSPWCFTWILPFSDTLDYAANMEQHTRRLRLIAQILADYNCHLGLEFVGPKTMRDGHRYPFIHTLSGALELRSLINTGNTGLLLDCWHWYTSHATLEELAHLTANDIVYVHVNDAPTGLAIDEQQDHSRMLPGATGVIDIVGFLQALDHIQYHGPIAAEPFNAEVNALPSTDRVRATGESMRTIFQRAALSS